MATETVKCEKCGGAAHVKATLPAETTPPADAPLPAEIKLVIYCARCGMRSQSRLPKPRKGKPRD